MLYSIFMDAQTRSAVVVASLCLSFVFVCLFFVARRVGQWLTKSGGRQRIPVDDGEAAPLLAAAPRLSHAQDQPHATVSPLEHEDEKHREGEDGAASAVAVLVSDTCGGPLHAARTPEYSALATDQRDSGSLRRGGRGDGESLTPRPPTAREEEDEEERQRPFSYGSTDSSGNNSGNNDHHPLRKGNDVVPCEMAASKKAERDRREAVEQAEQLARTRLHVAQEQQLLDALRQERGALEQDVAALRAYRTEVEQNVMPALFGDLQTAAEELEEAETAMLTSVDRQQKVLRALETDSVSQERALLTRITAVVSQFGANADNGKLSSSSRTPRPRFLS